MAAGSTARRRWNGGVLVVAMACVAGGALAADQPQSQATVSGPRWGHEIQQLAPDPAVRFGRLPNGLRYALQHNETPADGVAMRLRIGSGSLQERDGEEGLAHLLEHMAFRGSANLADGEVVRLLQRQGLAYGPDTNASTYQHQTVYWFNFPRADAASLDAGLLAFREIGERLTLDPQLIEREKGVVLSEARLRDTPAQRAEMAELGNTWAGTRVPRRWPIGLTASVQAATAEKLRRYYRANYRPDNATLVIVGRIDVDAVERQIRERFADWRSSGPADRVETGAVQGAKPVVEFVGAGVTEKLSLTWQPQPAAGPSGAAQERARLALRAALAVLESKLLERRSQPDKPYESYRAQVVDGRAKLEVFTRPGRWREALDAAVEELRRLLAQGVQPADLYVPLWRMKAELKAAAEPTAVRNSIVIADALLSAAGSDEALTSPAQAWASAEPVLAALQPEEVSAALRDRFAGTPLLFHSAQSERVGVEALKGQLARAMSRPLPERAPPPAAVASLTVDLGGPSKVVNRVTDADLGTTRVDFANGTRLLVKPTAFDKGNAAIRVLLGQGLSGIAQDRCHARWALDKVTLAGMTHRGSVGYIGMLDRMPHGFVLRIDWGSGTLPLMLKSAAVFVRDAAYPAELADQLASAGPALLKELEAQAGSVFQREMARVMAGDKPCLAGHPNAAEVRATRLADLSAVLNPAFAAAVDVVVVGDLTVEDAIAAVQASFGTGPARPRLPRLPLRVQPLPPGEPPHVVKHRGRADQAMLGLFWPLPDFWTDPALDATGHVAAAVLQARLMESVRETLGLTYSPSVRSFASAEVQGQGSFVVELETPPGRFQAVRQLLKAQLQALAAEPVSPDELKAARQPLIEGLRAAGQQNAYWAALLLQTLDDARIKSAILETPARLPAVTPARIQAFFRDHIARRAPIEVQAVAASSQPTPSPSAP
jgi:zinc protease